MVARTSELQTSAEQLALVLTDHGLQRMTARVLATLLFSEQPHVTMADLGDALQASSGAISGAVKTLTSVGLAERVPVPGSRRDHYRLRSNAWAVLFTNQNQTLAAMRAAANAGLMTSGGHGPASRRLTEMRDFYDFLLSEIPALLDRWQQHSNGSASTPSRDGDDVHP